MRKIIHVDMDCFYAAVEIKHRPSLACKAIAVGGSPDTRSVICTSNYEARRFGVKAAMPSSRAVRLCPDLVLIPPNFDLYKKESQAIRKIFERYTNKVEPLSLDEAYLDVTELCKSSQGLLTSASKVAQEIRRQIKNELNLPASAGIAPNKFLAKIASDWRKPNNQFTIQPHEIEAFMPSLPVEKIFGIGPVGKAQLNQSGIQTCGDLQKLSLYELQRLFGRRSSDMHKLCRGLDEREVKAHPRRKSLTVEETFNIDLKDFAQVKEKIPSLYEDWISRFSKSNEVSRIKSWVVKVKYFDFRSTTHELSSTAIPQVNDFMQLLSNCFQKRSAPIRLLGLGVRLTDEYLTDSSQLLFF